MRRYFSTTNGWGAVYRKVTEHLFADTNSPTVIPWRFFDTKLGEIMKRLLFFLSLCFICTAAVTEQISINWGADNQLYTTTTCEIGDNVILPSAPTKRGHIFKGWQAVHVDRGTFATWEEIPSDPLLYNTDFYNNNAPKKGDYIIVKNSSGYCSHDIFLQGYYDGKNPYIDVTYNGSLNNLNLMNCEKGCNAASDILSIYFTRDGWYVSIYAKTDSVYKNGAFYNTGDLVLKSFYSYIKTHVYLGCEHHEKWKFVYHGIWEVDGKNGWKPETQITE